MKRTILIAAIAVAAAVLTAVGQADPGFQGGPDAIDRAVAARQAELHSGFQGSPDAVDRAVAVRQTELASAFDAREHAQLRIARPMPDVFERAVAARERTLDPTTTPDAYQPVTTSGFDWADFGLGAGAGIGLVLVLGGIAGLGLRRSHGRVTTA